mgnify:CR=1 FL=1
MTSLIYTWQDNINPECIKKLDRKTSLQYLDFFNTFVSSDAYKKFTYHSRRKNRSNFYQAMKNNKRRVEELWRQPAAKTFEENIKVEQTNQ